MMRDPMADTAPPVLEMLLPCSGAVTYISSSEEGDSPPGVSASMRAASRMRTLAVRKLSKPASCIGESELYLACSGGISVQRNQPLHLGTSSDIQAYLPIVGRGS